MDSAEQSQLRQILQCRRDVIADHWNKAIARTSFVPLDAPQVRLRLVELTEQAIAVLLTEPLKDDEARAIGVSLVRLHHVQPEALGRTVQILASQLTQDLSAEQAALLQPRLAALLGALSAGFVQQTISTVLSEQEQIRGALVASLQKAEEALREAYDRVEHKVRERTAELARANQQLLQEIAERRRAEEALRESEARYRAVSELSSDYAFAYRVEPDGTMASEWVTEAFTRISGYTSGEIEAHGGWMSVIHPDDVPPSIQRMQAVYSGESVTYEIRLIAKSGQVRWLYIHARPVWDKAQGRVVRLYGAAQDITERKQAEEALRESEARYRAVSELSSDFAYAYYVEPDGATVLEWITDAFTRISDYTMEEIKARGGWTSVFHPDDVQPALRRQAAALSGESVAGQVRIITKSGQVRWLHVHSQPVWDEAQARVVRFYGAAQDITERKQAEEALRQLNHDLVQLYQMSQTLAATLDLQQVSRQLAQSVTEITGAEGSSIWMWHKEPADELVCQAAFPPNREGALVGLRRRAGQGVVGWVAQNGKSAVIPDALQDPRFSPDIDAATGFRTWSLLAVPLRTQDTVIGVLEVVNKLGGEFDMHDQALAETLAGPAAITIKNAQLVEALRQSAVTLQARNEELDAFAHTVAHDLKNPLLGVVGNAELLTYDYATLPDEERLRFLQSIVRSGHKMNNIIDELLLLAGLRNIDAEIELLDMPGIVVEAQRRLADMIAASQAEIVLPVEWPVALGYAPWVEEVWVNYLSNAIKYSGRPPRMELGAEMRPDGRVRFWVRDNGPGLSPEDQARLFIPFTRLVQARARGHGLGLSIVRRIVEKLGGQVGVEGRVGHGSLFYFDLPQAVDKLSRADPSFTRLL